MPKVLESLDPRAIRILDFRFRILDLKTVVAIERKILACFNPQSKFQNPKLW
jgi:hypothetical protein